MDIDETASGSARTTVGWAAERLDALLPALVVVAGAVGVALPAIGRSVDHMGAIDPTLAVLVLTAGLSVEIRGLRRVKACWSRLLLALAVSTVTLPVLAWALSRGATGGVREGILAVGVAPSEVATIALTALAGGEVGFAAVLVCGSSVVTVATAGPILSLLADAPSLHPVGLLTTLALVVALPLVVGAALRQRCQHAEAVFDVGRIVGTVALLLLLWEAASEVRLDAGYLVAAPLLLLFLVGAGALGVAMSHGLDRSGQPGILFPLAMRDFAVAAGIAASAFGPGSTGSLALYGLLVLLFGAVGARRLRRRPDHR